MRKRFKITLTIIATLIILITIILISLQFETSKETTYQQIDEIANYEYTLKDRDTELMKEVFLKLKNTLTKEEIKYEEYALYLSELFIIDLYTIDNKTNKYDVGSINYILPDIRDNYRLNVEETIYKFVEDKSISKREKEYPIVKSIKEETIDNITYKYNDILYDGYKVTLNWEYEKELGYDKFGEITLINKDNKLYIVSYKGVDQGNEEEN